MPIYQAVMQDVLGEEWLAPNLFRIGASRLLGDLVAQLEHV